MSFTAEIFCRPEKEARALRGSRVLILVLWLRPAGVWHRLPVAEVTFDSAIAAVHPAAAQRPFLFAVFLRRHIRFRVDPMFRCP
jgi:hypothetical protein